MRSQSQYYCLTQAHLYSKTENWTNRSKGILVAELLLVPLGIKLNVQIMNKSGPRNPLSCRVYFQP